MAEKYTPEEIQEIFDAYNDSIRAGIPVSKDLAEKMADATKGVKNYTSMLNQSMSELGSSFKSLGSSIAKGDDGASIFNDAITASGKGLGNVASKFGKFGTVLSVAIAGVAKYATTSVDQAQALYKSFQEISKTGTLGAGGMAEVFSSLQKFGYNVGELNKMQALLAENSQTLARFGGTAFRGQQQFANLADSLQRGELGEKFRNMGMDVDGINRSAAGFIKTQVMLGQNRSAIERNLNSETVKYIENLSVVQRLTGQTREQLEEKEQQALKEQAFAYRQYELKMRAAAGDEAAAREYTRNQQLARSLQGKTREQFVAMIGGDLAAAGDLLRTAPEFVEKVLSGADLPETMDALTRGFRNTVDSIGPLAKLNALDDSFIPLYEQFAHLAQYGGADFAGLAESARKNMVSTDNTTQAMTSYQISIRELTQAFDRFINNGIDPAVAGLRQLANAAVAAQKIAPDVTAPGYGQSGTSSMGGSLTATGAGGAVAATAAVGMGLAAAPATALILGGGAVGYGLMELFGGEKIKPEDVLEFGSESGSRASFDKLDRELQGRVLKAADQYFKTTGKKLRINSGYRDPAKQQELWNRTGGTGRLPDGTPVAPPGKSAHERGLAIDIQQGSSGDAEAINILNRNGLYQTVPNDPVHFQRRGDEVSGAFGWQGTVSGPMSGYRPNLLMHGTEELSIKPAAQAATTNSTADNEMLIRLVDRLDDLINVGKAQLGVNERILKYQQ